MNNEDAYNTPPRLLIAFFRAFCRRDLVEDIEGDLRERYDLRVQRKGMRKARWLLTKDVFQLFRPGMIRSIKGTQKLNFYDMFKHNLTLSIRTFRRYPGNFFINLTGLTAGLISTLFIYLWVADELAVDRFHDNAGELFHVMSNHKNGDEILTWKGVPGLLLEEIQQSVPEAKWTVASTDPQEFSLKNGEIALKATGKFASTDFFQAFTFPLVAGDPNTVLEGNSGIVISESLAKNLFGEEQALGQNLEWFFRDRKEAFIITGVMEDVPANTSEKFDFLLTWDFYHNDLIEFKNWGNYYGRLMVVLNDASTQAAAGEKIDAIFELNNDGQKDRVTLFLTSYADRYLYSAYKNGVQAGGKIEYVKLFVIVGAFVLLIACINFVNLSTAKATQRAKETGVKKSLGASRGSLVVQFITESILLSAVSMALAIGLVYLFLPQFNNLAQKSLSLDLAGPLGGIITLFVLAVGLLAGSYPAFYLSRFDAIKALKGTVLKPGGRMIGRKSLVIVQFTISTILIVGVLIVYEQMQYVKNTSLGYDRTNLVYFEREGQLLDKDQAFLDELKNVPGVNNASRSGFMVGGSNATGGVSWEGKPEDANVRFWEVQADLGMLEMMNIELVKGRHFSADFVTDSTALIINEAAMKVMGMEDPIGKTIQHYTGTKRIVGVVKDFNMISLHSQVEPTLFRFEPKDTHFIMAKLDKGNEAGTLRKIDKLYRSFNPDYAFNPIFLEQDYLAQYESEERMGILSRYFALFAIVISCLGLFGLASFMTERRTKEIGVRKVLGSGTAKIVYMLTADFSKTVLIAIIIGIPVSYYIGELWLDGFAYKINLTAWYFIGAGLMALCIAWLTVGFQTLRAARANPAQSLRSE